MVVRIPSPSLDCLDGMDYRDSQGGMDVMVHLDLRAHQELVSSALDYPNFVRTYVRMHIHISGDMVVQTVNQ